MNPIYLRNLPPPAEKFNHVQFFDFLFSYIKPELYLELGVRDGINFNTVSKYCKHSIGVDIVPTQFALLPNQEYYQTSTDNFFKNINKDIKFDAIFIDADHSHEQSLKDFINAKDHLIDDGFIFFHDTYPCEEFWFNPGLCNDAYKTALYIKENFIDDFEILTLPFHPGVTIVKKMKRNKQLIWK